MSNSDRPKIGGVPMDKRVLPAYLKMIMEARDKLERKWGQDKKMSAEKKRYLKDLTDKISQIKKILDNG